HLLPEDNIQLSILARKMGIAGNSKKELSEKLRFEFDRHTLFVGELFAGLFGGEKKRAAVKNYEERKEGKMTNEVGLTLDSLNGVPFDDPERALRFLKSLRDGPQFSHPSEKSIREFYAVLPRILEVCVQVPLPNSAVENLVKFVETSRARDSYLNLFQSNERFLELLLTLFGSSEFLSGTLIRQPGVVDVLRDLESIYRFKPPEKITEELNQGLEQCEDFETKKIFLRQFKDGEELRVGIRYLIREGDLLGTLVDLSNLAIVYLQVAYLTALEE
ncbi:MAG: hypothetical protein QGG54_21550, partial [Gammaproteobacteria bacterium]|nr:hypothetical protein [Gammaproteobacteria bacterium]